MIRPTRRAALVLTAAAAATTAATVAGAQQADLLQAGARLRVTRVGPPLRTQEGVFVTADSTRIVLAIGPDGLGRDTMPRVDVREVAVHVGRRTAGAAFGRGAGWGALVGASVGLVATTLTVADERRNPCDDCFVSAPLVVGVLSVAFTAVTTLVGGAIGLAHRDRWETVAVP